jgi:outer membrane assembly lipoprotein YfiO
MNRWFQYLLLAILLATLFPPQSPAPLVWRRGEGWTWERAGVPTAATPKEQMELGKGYEKSQEWDLAIICYQRLLARWPTSAFAAESQYRIGICYEMQELYYEALLAYQRALERYPNTPQFREILERQFKIGNLFLGGMKHKIWRFKIFPGLDKAVAAFERVIKNAPFSDLAPQAQFNIGIAYEKQGKYVESVGAFLKILDKYYDTDWGDKALFQLGVAYFKQSRSADYDKDAARRALDAFQEFIANRPDDKVRVDAARQYIAKLHEREAEGLFKIARFYDRQQKHRSAVIYYSELVRLHGESEFAKQAIPRLEELKARLMPAAAASVPK